MKELAHDLGWEGDMREGPSVSVMPDPQTGGALLLTAFKKIGSQMDGQPVKTRPRCSKG